MKGWNGPEKGPWFEIINSCNGPEKGTWFKIINEFVKFMELVNDLDG